jgi:hypothetical protein
MQKLPHAFIALKSLKQGSAGPGSALAEIRRIYFTTTRRTIQHDVAHAIELLKSLPTEDERQKAAVYMDGLSQMCSEWGRVRGKVEPPKRQQKGKGRGKDRSRVGPT